MKKFWPAAALLSPFLPLMNYFWGNWYSFFHAWSLSMTAGIFSYIYFLNVLILSTRIRYFDRLYGHDRVIQFHSLLAMFSLITAILHSRLKEIYDMEGTFQIEMGEWALRLFFIIMLLSLLAMVKNIIHRIPLIEKLRMFITTKLKTGYTRLKIIHNVMALAVVLMAVHVLLAVSTSESLVRILIMGLWAAVSVALYVNHKFIRPVKLGKQGFTVQDVVSLGNNMTELHMSSPVTSLKYKAGQFAFFRIKSEALGYEEHPFSFSSAPTDKDISITVKNLGDYTSHMKDIKKGDKVIIDGPYGIFTAETPSDTKVLIAGGIGITPFHSLLRQYEKEGFPSEIILFWAARKKEDLVYQKYFSELAEKEPRFTYIPVLSDEPEWKDGITGFITAPLIQEITKEPARADFYICGPEIMRNIMLNNLKTLKVPAGKIRYEMFSLI